MNWFEEECIYMLNIQDYKAEFDSIGFRVRELGVSLWPGWFESKAGRYKYFNGRAGILGR